MRAAARRRTGPDRGRSAFVCASGMARSARYGAVNWHSKESREVAGRWCGGFDYACAGSSRDPGSPRPRKAVALLVCSAVRFRKPVPESCRSVSS